jgi:SAM-dependent methyltransferase
LSDASIKAAKQLALKCKVSVDFICCDLYDLENHLNEDFDMVFTSYGTIIWLPDLTKWANVVSSLMKKGGQFVFADFHPLVWMYDDNFEKIIYPYLNREPIVEEEEGTYAQKEFELNTSCITWNHGLSESSSALLNSGLTLKEFHEHDYAPYEFVKGMTEFEKGKFRIKAFADKAPLVFSMLWKKD